MTDWFKSKSAKRAAIAAVLVVSVIVAGYVLRYAGRVISVASAFYAKTLCSGVLLAQRSEDDVVKQDVLADMSFGLRHLHREIYRDRGLVSITTLGMGERLALFRPGLGCTLVTDTSVEALREQARDFTPPAPAPRSSALWPEGARVDPPGTVDGVDGGLLKAAVDEAFAEPNPRALRRTRAVVVVHKGAIVAERYGPGIGPQTLQLGWSMGKTILNALTGTLVSQGLLTLDQDQLFTQWRGEGDPRGRISVDDLLRMVSGLDFDAPQARMLSDVRKMLFLKGDSVAYAASEELAAPVGASWFYSSGSASLLAGAMRAAIGGSQARYFSYPRRALFERIGMTSAVIEPDAAGNFLAPAFAYATARDWARFGQLYLNDGMWRDKRILPEGWVKNSLAPTPHSNGQYGAGLWLKIPDFLRPPFPANYRLPEDAFYMLGHDGQMVAVIPSRQLVVVRLGLSRRRGAWDHGAFLNSLLRAFAKAGG